jgi:hypothetical protein
VSGSRYIHGKDTVNVGGIESLNECAFASSRTGNESVNGPKERLGFLHCSENARTIGHVTLDSHRLSSCTRDFLD